VTWVKICGMTNLEDALVAVEAGADAVGFVFYEKSPRYVTVETARAIVEKLPRSVEKVGVFVNQDEKVICSTVDRTGITGVQMHGDEEDPHVADLIANCRPGIGVLAAISMHHASPGGWAMMWEPKSIRGFLLDSGRASQHGGTGKAFDWKGSVKTVGQIRALGEVIAAGGLTPENVGEAMEILKPWGVDVVSGVEAEPGKKDPEKVRAFVRAVREVDRKVG
jgi:phosphoribosylanthranilate isomerase